MLTIIRPRQYHYLHRARGHCKECGCIFETDESQVTKVQEYDSEHVNLWLSCPECNNPWVRAKVWKKKIKEKSC